jgi:hypothetical protein
MVILWAALYEMFSMSHNQTAAESSPTLQLLFNSLLDQFVNYF